MTETPSGPAGLELARARTSLQAARLLGPSVDGPPTRTVTTFYHAAPSSPLAAPTRLFPALTTPAVTLEGLAQVTAPAPPL